MRSSAQVYFISTPLRCRVRHDGCDTGEKARPTTTIQYFRGDAFNQNDRVITNAASASSDKSRHGAPRIFISNLNL